MFRATADPSSSLPPHEPVIPRRPFLAAATFALSLAAAACSDGRDGLELSGQSQGHSVPRLWTLYDLKKALINKEPVATTKTFPAGLAATEFLTPTVADDSTVRILPAFSEGNAAAYMVSAVWADFDEIWAQPWYFLVTTWNPANAQGGRLKDDKGVNTPPIFDPRPDSRFYSPFWLVYYVEVDPKTPPTKYTSTDQLANDGRLAPPYRHLSSAFTYDVHPADVTIPAVLPMGSTMPADARALHPIVGTPVSNISSSTSYSDGQTYPYFNEGGSNFNYDENFVVEEVPLFMFVRQTGERVVFKLAGQEMDAPRVMGSVPLFSRRQPEVAAAGPRFGAYSRLHLAVLPATALVYDDSRPDLDAALVAKMLDPKLFYGRIAYNGDAGCFKAKDFPAPCVWLDSQAKVEESVGRINVKRTEVSLASPLVFFNGRAR